MYVGYNGCIAKLSCSYKRQ